MSVSFLVIFVSVESKKEYMKLFMLKFKCLYVLVFKKCMEGDMFNLIKNISVHLSTTQASIN